MDRIMLGDKVSDKVSGYTGIAVARSEFLNGCIQYMVARRLKNNQKVSTFGDPSFDEMVLEVVERKVIVSKEYEREEKLNKEKESKESKIGGRTKFMRRMKGY